MLCLLKAQRPTLSCYASKTFVKNTQFYRTNLSNVRSFHKSSVSLQTPVPMQRLGESFIDGTSAYYVEQMYEAYKKDPNSVHVSWKAYFDAVEKGVPPGEAHKLPPNVGGGVSYTPFVASVSSSPVASSGATEQTRIINLVRAYQKVGHLSANLDPLKMEDKKRPEELDYRAHGFSEADLDREFSFGIKMLGGFLAEGRPKLTLRKLIERLEQTYCGTIGVEFMHMNDLQALNWIREKFETVNPHKFSSDEKVVILDRLGWSTKFERYLATKFTGMKRFGVDGCESLIPGIKALIDKAANLGIDHIVMGMPHRGRLNVLANVVRKPLAAIFHEFSGGSVIKDDFYTGSGDVKYHLGTSYFRPTRSGKKVHLTLLANPSHLEAVDPVVEGKTRATQYYRKDEKREQVMSMQLHGDAAFAAQGIVYETIGLSGLENYTTGGTVHIVVNNQIGFTTDPRSARSTMYCTDIAKAAGVPVFHVNADDPEAVVHVCEIAAEWRQKFHKDIVIDMICYRRHGHNEGDEPRFTQPIMYKKIDAQRAVFEKYIEQLVKSNVVSNQQVQELNDKIQGIIDGEYKKSSQYAPTKTEWIESVWKGFDSPAQIARIQKTSAPLSKLKQVGEVISNIPSGITLHPTLKKTMTTRKHMIETGEKLDWAVAEALAFGTLLLEGNHVRLSGQDVERGTFSHRHAVVHDQNSDKTYTPLNNISPQQEKFIVSNSSLSEYGVMGFELGYSLANPNSLVLWEAQFGDFVNGAQIIIDQFLSSGESKWHRQSGLVLLLPHGYDGQGPEHSSGRIERFLQLCDGDSDVVPTETNDEKLIQRSNIQVVNCSTPANYFHVLRRQIHRAFRKPLIVMSPKNLLRHPRAISSLKEMSDEFGENAKFHKVIPETAQLVADKDVARVVFCTGKVYYELLEEREKRGIKDIALVRIEQLYPFPFDAVVETIKKYSRAQVIWCQEEPKNMGSWSFINNYLRTCARAAGRPADFFPGYAGRPAAASPATGYGSEHTRQLQNFLNVALSPK